MGVAEEAGKAATATVSAMSSQPLAIALLVINIGFLAFAGYVLGEVAANASERNKSQLELISNLVRDIRDCRQGPSINNK
jgi:Tfp pilus assembly protein PilV